MLVGVSVTTTNMCLSLTFPARLDLVSTQESDPLDATTNGQNSLHSVISGYQPCVYLGLEALVGLYAVPGVPEAQILLFPKPTQPNLELLRRPSSIAPTPAVSRKSIDQFKPQSNSPSSSHPRVP